MAISTKAGSLARARIEAALYDLKHRYSDFIYPLSLLKWEECQEESKGRKCFATDGITVFYFSKQVLTNSKEHLQYEIMHIVMHGLLGHFQIKDYYKETLYRDLIMDIQVKYLMLKSGIQPHLSQYGMNHIDRLLNRDYSMGQYYTLRKSKEVARNPEFLQQLCRGDDHAFWDRGDSENFKLQITVFWGNIQQAVLGEAVNVEDMVLWLDEAASEGMDGSQGLSGLKGKNTSEGKTFDKGNNGADRKSAAMEKAEKLCKQLMKALGGMLAGAGMGSEQARFAVGQSGRKDYGELLKELFSKTEVCREEPDSIDPMFYHYGFELYEDVPLIEPLETCEQVAFHTLAIAIDVSGSCTDKETMECFWGETYRCISQLKERHAQGQILLLQCDDGIQKEELLELEELDETPAEVSICGSGGTSFVPVFERLTRLEEDGGEVDALLYLTDGYGRYPENKPDYPVYFVLPDSVRGWIGEEQERDDIPDWIEQVWLNKES